MTSANKSRVSAAAGALAAVLASAVFVWSGAARADGLLYKLSVLSVAAAFPRAAASAAVETLFADEPEAADELLPPEAAAPESEPAKPEQTELHTAETVYADSERAESIPEDNRGTVAETQYPSAVETQGYFFYESGCIRNGTALSDAELAAEAAKPSDVKIELNSALPQVLIFHTHTTESFGEYDAEYYDKTKSVRSTDPNQNIISAGSIVASQLNEAGINTLHATEYHDYPSFEGAYMRSADTVKGYLAKYPSIKVVIDLHRDGIEREDGTRIKPVTMISGEKAAQIMIVCNADDGSIGHPDYLQNLRFAARLQSEVEALYPGLARPALLDYRDYNQFLSSGMLLVEIGSHGNTLDEAKRSARCFGRALADALRKTAA